MRIAVVARRGGGARAKKTGNGACAKEPRVGNLTHGAVWSSPFPAFPPSLFTFPQSPPFWLSFAPTGTEVIDDLDREEAVLEHQLRDRLDPSAHAAVLEQMQLDNVKLLVRDPGLGCGSGTG